MYLLDTSALIELIDGTAIGEKVQEITSGEPFAMASFSVFELLEELREHEREKTENLIAKTQVLEFDREAAIIGAAISKQLKKSGKTVPKFDACIAAICLKYGMTLITTNPDFERVPNLKVKFIKQ